MSLPALPSGEGSIRLVTDRLLVRTMAESDLAAIFACYDNPEVGQYCAPVRWPNIDHAHIWFKRRRDDVIAGRAKQLVIESKAKGVVVGTSVLFDIDATHRRAEVGYALGREFWGMGYVTEAVTAVINYAFGELQLHRLYATIDPRNFASAKTLSRLGFRHEGTLRETYVDAGEFTDAGLYGLLAREWKNSPVSAGNTPI